MKHFGGLLVLVIIVVESHAGELYQDFRGKNLNEKFLRLQGGDAALRVKAEPEGLRITMPAEPKGTTVGVATRPATTGDFEIAVGYEILQADRPLMGNGVGLEMYLNTNTPTQEALAFYRMARPKDGEVYVCDKKTTIDGKRQTTRRTFPADSKSGQLLLTRKGSEVAFAVAAGLGAAPQELCRYEWGPMDVHISVRAWGSHNPVDLRLTEMRVRDQTVAEPVASAAVPPRGRGLLVVGLLGALLVAAAGFWAWRRLADSGMRQTAPADSVLFFCAACGKRLKTSTSSRGKTVPCPACGQPAPVPGTMAGDGAAGRR